jgi:membrane associated rhomboid family serine protease
MAPGSKLRLSIEILIAVAAFIFLAAALASPDWIEKTLGVSPDNGDGSIEWGAAFGAVAVFLAMSWLARRDWRTRNAADRAAEVGEGR